MSDPKLAIAVTLNNLGEFYHFQGKYTQAEKHYKDAFSIRNPAVSLVVNPDGDVNLDGIAPEDTDTATILHNLARLYVDMGEYEDAERFYPKVLEIRKKAASVPDLVITLNNLAMLYHYIWANYPKAKELYLEASQQALKGKMISDSFEVTDIRINLERLYLDQDKNNPTRFDAVKKRYDHALEVCEQALEKNIPLAAIRKVHLLNDMAIFYYRHNKPVEARPLSEKAKKLYEEHSWTNPFFYASILTNYADLLRTLGFHSKAASYYKEIEQIYAGEECYQVANFLSDYAKILFEEGGSFTRVDELYTRAVAIYRKKKPCLGHDEVITTLRGYAAFLKQYGEASKATPVAIKSIYDAMLTAYDYKEGELKQHPQIANVLSNQALFQKNLEARKNIEEALRIYNEFVKNDVNNSRVVFILKKCVLVLQNYATLTTNFFKTDTLKEIETARDAFEEISKLDIFNSYNLYKESLRNEYLQIADIYGRYSNSLEAGNTYDNKAQNMRKEAG